MNDYDRHNNITTADNERDKLFEIAHGATVGNFEIDEKSGLDSIAMSELVAQIFYNMRWDIVVTEDQHFITSDHPVVHIVGAHDGLPNPVDGGFNNRKSIVTLPLTSTKMLFMTWSGSRKGQVLPCDKDVVSDLNRMRAKNAEQQLYASKHDSEVEKIAEEYSNYRPRISIADTEHLRPVKAKRKKVPFAR
jgi:hypothetical protein